MNVSLPKLSVMLALLVLPCWLWAQGAETTTRVQIETYANTPIPHLFVSNPNKPNISTQPINGVLSMVEDPTFQHTVTYTPDADFIGVDSFKIWRWLPTPAAHPDMLIITVQVKPAAITAKHDYATTMQGDPITVDVLANDVSSNGIVLLAATPAVNHGVLTTNADGTISFTPNPHFQGLAHFNYVVCNGIGDCDEGTVSISVVGPMPPDTVRVYTKKNKAQFILAPSEYTLLTGPDHGIYDPAADVPTYTPEADYVGLDYLTFTYNSKKTVYVVDVLDLKDNKFSVEDRVFTTTNSEIEFNVLNNDAYGTDAGCFTYSQPLYGSVAPSSALSGDLVYTPAPGFIGVDEFTYTSSPPGCAGEAETVKAYVFVSNFEPAASYFRMATPRKTPIIIGYNVPVNTFHFSVTNQGRFGNAFFLNGPVDTTIYGARIQGYNLLIYSPHAAIKKGVDQFEITYCLQDPAGGCAVSKTVKIEMHILDVGSEDPSCVGDCVWAGDTNFDGVVNMEDLLPIGLRMGEIGRARPDVDFSQWYGQYGQDWNDLFGQGSAGFDLKHVDADGDSIVTALDTAAIRQFYGRTHNMVPRQLPFTDFDLYLEGDIFVEPGDMVTLNIMVGTEETPAENVYGFVFPFDYSPEMFVPQSVKVDFSSSSWLSYDSPVLFMQHNNRKGKLEAGFTRTSGLSASGRGKIGEVSFVVVEDIQGIRPDSEELLLTIGGNTATSMNGAGQSSAVHVAPYTLRIQLKPTEETPAEEQTVRPEQLKTFPNPTRDYLTVHLNGGRTFQQVALYDMQGRRLQFFDGLDTNHAELNMSSLPEGMYILQVGTPQGVINRKVEVLR